MQFKYILLVFVLIKISNAWKIDFLADLLKDRNVSLTLSACWNYRDFKSVIVRFRDKQVGVYRNSDITTLGNFDLYILDTINCQSSWNALNTINKTGNFKYPSKYIIIVDEESLEKFNNGNYTISITSQVTFVQKMSDDYINLFQMYKIHATGSAIIENHGNWSRKSGLKLVIQNPLSARRRNMRGVFFKVNYLFEDNSTVNYIHTFKYPTIDTFAKQNFGAFSSLMDLCNITYQFVLKEKYGYFDKKTGKFNGIIGSLENKETEFSASSMLFTKERLQFVDYIKEMNPQDIKILYKAPSVSYVTGIFSVAFHKLVWLSLFALMILFSVLAYFILKEEYRNRLQQPQFINGVNVSDAVLISLESFCQQGSMTDPKSISGRILFFSILLSCMVMYVAYSGNIVVLLQSTKPFNNLEEFLQSPMEAGTMETSYMHFYMTRSTLDPVRQQIYKTKIGPKGYYSMQIGLDKLQKSNFAFHMETIPAYHYMQKQFSEDEICSIQKLDGYIPTNLGYMPVQKNSSYKKILKVGMLKIAEHGLHQRHFNRFLANPKCYYTSATFKSVGFIDAYQAYVIFICGLHIAVGIFLLEIFHKKFVPSSVKINAYNN